LTKACNSPVTGKSPNDEFESEKDAIQKLILP
jgi:hypothetical protein